MWSLRAWLVGTGAAALVLYTGAAALGVAVAAGGGTLEVGLGNLILLEVARSSDETVTTFGLGLAVAALAAGALNVTAAALLVRRRGMRGRG